ncbi:MAG TPA: ATP-dependent DNA helicase [Acidimicrobiales bacterium]|nr:ATP-dependent DNA helicase [Acidimicrobiales bacterium]
MGDRTNVTDGSDEPDELVDGSDFPDAGLADELDVEQAFGTAGCAASAASAADARQAGDEGVEGLEKITAQMAGGEDRPEQQEMCRAVAEALVTGTHLVVQAGTGTGKSLAYLVPAALSGKKVVVATATKALQNQLAEKDLPLVESGLGLPVPLDIAVLKGRSNYICRQRVAEVGSGGIQAELGDQTLGRADEPDWEAPEAGAGSALERATPAPEGMVEEVRQLVAWSQTARTGDRADLSFEPSDRAWNMLSVGPRECPGAFNCPSGGSCFAEAARDRAATADIVVVNTHLYGAHLASGGVVLPEHDVVVFDEAHELEEVMTASLGVELTSGRFRTLVTAARSLIEAKDTELLDSLAAAGDLLGTLLADHVGERVLQEGARASVDDTDLSDLLARAADVSRRVVDALRRSGAQRSFISGDGDDPDRASRKTRTLQAAAHLAEDLHRLVGRSDSEVAWVDGTRRNARLRLSPIDVGPALSAMLWGTVTSVLTSATIPPRVVERVGLEEFPTDELNVGSPFDYRAHALLYVARHLPDRRAEGAEDAVFAELGLLIEAAGGRTLALFTSRRATDAAAEALAEELPYTLLLQGDLPKGRLLEEFAADETSCLFATLGFWQGVDIPGRALSLVTIDRLPFPRPDDPLLQARRDRAGGRAFSLVDLPRAATLLAQGAGRLIRTADDKGVVAVLDPRLATASYRGVLLATLPPMRRSVDRGEVASFLQRALDEDDGAGSGA